VVILSRVLRSLRPESRTQGAFYGCTQIRRALDDVNAGIRERGHLFGGGAFAAGNDRPGMAHSSPRWRGLSGYEADNGLLEMARDERGGVLLGVSAYLL